MAKPSPPEETAPAEAPAPPAPSRWGLEEADRDLIRWMLAKTPVERLRYAQDFATGIAILKNGRRV